MTSVVATSHRLPILVGRPVGAQVGGAPAACLRECLEGDATNLGRSGCAWLKAAVAGRPSDGLLDAGRCPRGFDANAVLAEIDSVPHVLISVAAPAEALTRLRELEAENESLADEVLQGYEQLNFIFEINGELIAARGMGEIKACVRRHLSTVLHSEAQFLDEAVLRVLM